MNKKNLNELVERVRDSGVPTYFDVDKSRLLIHVWRLVAEGKPVTSEQVRKIAAKMQMPAEAATSFISRLSEQDDKGNIVGIFGLSQRNHPHKFQVKGRTFSTWCAWDALFLPAMLKQTAYVQSSCPATKEKINLTIAPERIEHYEPARTVLSIITPRATKKGIDCVEEVWTAFCCHVHFFSSSYAAFQWFSGKDQDAIILSVEEGYQLGQLAFKDLLNYV